MQKNKDYGDVPTTKAESEESNTYVRKAQISLAGDIPLHRLSWQPGRVVRKKIKQPTLQLVPVLASIGVQIQQRNEWPKHQCLGLCRYLLEEEEASTE